MAKKKLPPDERAFLDSIAADPEDDAPRLVFADWLDDHGLAHRAEFVRLQCRLARMEEDDHERLDLELREADLLFVYGKQWAVMPRSTAEALSRQFRRGFPDYLSLKAADFLKRGRTLFAAAPITDLGLWYLGGKAAQVAASPLLGRLRALRLYESGLTPAGLRILGASPHLGGVRELTTDLALTVEHARALSGWPALPRLRRLELRAEARGLATLAGPGQLAGLRRFEFVGPARAAEFGGLRAAAPELTHLHLAGLSITPELLEALAGQPALTSLSLKGGVPADALADAAITGRLTSLRLESVQLSPPALAALSRGGRAGLRTLSLWRVSLGAEGRELLSSASLGGLVRLELTAADLDADAVRSLAASPHLAGLRWLCLDGCPLGDDGAAALAASPHLARLTELSLARCEIGPRGAAALAASPILSGLRRLCLDVNPLGDEGVAALAASPHLAGLHTLELDHAEVGEPGARALAQARGLGGLRRLKLRDNLPSVRSALGEFADPSRLPRLLWLATNRRRDGSMLAALGRPVVA
jgi:uncharacterized protein (TIGR02996 family)